MKSLSYKAAICIATLGLLLLILATAQFVPLSKAEGAVSYPASARVSGRIEYGYILVFNNLKLPEATTRVTFNISSFEKRLVLATATNGKFTVIGRASNGLLTFELPAPSTSINFTFVFDSLEPGTDAVKVVFPVPLSPTGIITNVTGQITLPQPINLKSVLGNATGATVKYNQSYIPGSLDVVSANVSSYGYPLYRVDELTRKITLTGDKIVFNDTLTVVSLADAWVEQLSFNLPRNASLVGIYWSYGKVPSPYINIYTTNQSKLILYRMLSSLQKRNQRVTFSLVYSFNATNAVPAYMGLGFIVKNYTIELCLPGIIQTVPEVVSTTVQNDMHCYKFVAKGPLFLYDTYPTVIVNPSFSKVAQSIPVGVYLLIALAVLAVIGAVYYVNRQRVSTVKTEALTRTLKQDERLGELAEILTRREEGISSLLDQLRGLRERKAGITKITSTLRAFEQRDREYERRAKEILSSLEGDWAGLVKELDEISNVIASTLRDIEKIERGFRTGRITLNDYNKMVDDLEERLLEISRRLSRLTSKYLA